MINVYEFVNKDCRGETIIRLIINRWIFKSNIGID